MKKKNLFVVVSIVLITTICFTGLYIKARNDAIQTVQKNYKTHSITETKLEFDLSWHVTAISDYDNKKLKIIVNTSGQQIIGEPGCCIK